MPGNVLEKQSALPVVLKGIAFAALALLSLRGAHAQDRPRPVPVTGTVVDLRRNSVSDAAVSLKQDSGKVVSSTKTDAAGRFRFAAVAPGNYSIEITHERFTDSTTPIEVGPNRPRR